MEPGSERELVLSPNESAVIQDKTKGHLNLYVGPYKTSLAQTDAPVRFDERSKKFVPFGLDQAINTFTTAPEGWYVVLKNPADGYKQPIAGSNILPEMNIGHKVNIQGPVSFPEWPGQMTRVIRGHRLRSNQYLLIRVYDEEAAKKDWKQAVLKPQTGPDAGGDGEPATAPVDPASTEGNAILGLSEGQDLTPGKEIVIKGTAVSFFMPPTGLEVVPDENGQYVRDAVTLEQLEYCTLLSENGSKRRIVGPDVVFPTPTEIFIEKDGARKFKAMELNEFNGVHVKVIADYKEGSTKHVQGEELFIKGTDTKIYIQRIEHAVMRHGGKALLKATVIPSGDAQYVLDRLSGTIDLKVGPCVFLPDPRKEMIIQRILDMSAVGLYYPGNVAVEVWNQTLADNKGDSGAEFLTSGEVSSKDVSNKFKETVGTMRSRGVSMRRRVSPQFGFSNSVVGAGAGAAYSTEISEDCSKGFKPEKTASGFGGDKFNRSDTISAPVGATLTDAKYSGAVAVDVWNGYAVLLTSKTGKREVVMGPKTVLLGYDESLEPMELSTGTPKTEKNTIRTVFLRVKNNRVSDQLTAETGDLVTVSLDLSYRVNFTGESTKWFDVDNYIKLLTDHLRSVLRAHIKSLGVEEFYANATSILRDTILGVAGEEADSRPGKAFAENSMSVYDVEVLGVQIGDKTIAAMIQKAQHETVQGNLTLSAAKRSLSNFKDMESIREDKEQARVDTEKVIQQAKVDETEAKKVTNLKIIEAEGSEKMAELARDLEQAAVEFNAEFAERKASDTYADKRAETALVQSKKEAETRLYEFMGRIDGSVKQAESLTPNLIAALQSVGDKRLLADMSTSMGPLALLGGESITDSLNKLIKGTPLEPLLNGGAHALGAAAKARLNSGEDTMV